jgi:hypothetical protein
MVELSRRSEPPWIVYREHIGGPQFVDVADAFLPVDKYLERKRVACVWRERGSSVGVIYTRLLPSDGCEDRAGACTGAPIPFPSAPDITSVRHVQVWRAEAPDARRRSRRDEQRSMQAHRIVAGSVAEQYVVSRRQF